MLNINWWLFFFFLKLLSIKDTFDFSNYPLEYVILVLTLVLLNPDIPCLCKQCRSRSVGFWRSQLIWICTVCHSVCESISTTLIKYSDWLKIRNGCGFLIYSAGEGLTNEMSNPFYNDTVWISIHKQMRFYNNAVCLITGMCLVFWLKQISFFYPKTDWHADLI